MEGEEAEGTVRREGLNGGVGSGRCGGEGAGGKVRRGNLNGWGGGERCRGGGRKVRVEGELGGKM